MPARAPYPAVTSRVVEIAYTNLDVRRTNADIVYQAAIAAAVAAYAGLAANYTVYAAAVLAADNVKAASLTAAYQFFQSESNIPGGAIQLG